MSADPTPTAAPARILVVDDDATFRERLMRALAARGFVVCGAASAEDAIEVAAREKPARAVVDLRMPGESGLALVSRLSQMDHGIQTVMLTGYGSIASAVDAVRYGAVNYLTKPADTDQILAAFDRDRAPADPPDSTPSLARVEWEHIQRIMADCNGNVSAAARKLGIHRRSLQRKLTRLAPIE